jgi:HlyD family type I secretion membrane fusion protein
MLLPTPSRQRSSSDNAIVIGAFESDTLDVIRRTTPKDIHIVVHAIAVMIVSTVLLMCVVKLDRVVTSTGRVLPAGGSLFVQPLEKSIVSAILVRPGDVVKKGQILARLDPTFATADFKQLGDKLESGKALVARLQAEQDGGVYTASDPNNASQLLQQSLWRQRQAEYRQSVADFDARINSDRSMALKAHQDLASDQKHLSLTTEMSDMQQELAKKGWGSKALMITADESRVQAARQLEESRNSEAQAGHELTALQAQKQAYISKWRNEVTTNLVQARNDTTQVEQEFNKASRVHDLSQLLAPADAVVLSVGNASVGSVIDPVTSQQALFTLTPIEGALEADVRVDARDVGFIRPGDHVTLKLDAFQFTSHGTAKGVVKSISAGSFTQSDEGQQVPPFFKVRVAITEAHLRNVPKDFRLVPGMTLSGDIVIGGRTIMAYLLGGALRTGSEAMREPQ